MSSSYVKYSDLTTLKNKYKKVLNSLKINSKIVCINQIEEIFNPFFTFTRTTYNNIVTTLQTTNTFDYMCHLMLKIYECLENLIDSKNIIDMQILEKVCFEIIKGNCPNIIMKILNSISENLYNLALNINEEIKFKVRLYIFNPFCFGKLINLIKKLYIKEFHEDIKQFYGLVNLKKFQQHLNDLNLNINILPPKEKIMPEEINNKSSTNIPLKENTSKENIENPNKITIDNNNNSLSENNSSKEKKKYQKRRQIK